MYKKKVYIYIYGAFLNAPSQNWSTDETNTFLHVYLFVVFITFISGHFFFLVRISGHRRELIMAAIIPRHKTT